MEITEVSIPLGFPIGGAPRSHGVHLSRVLRAIAFETGVLKPEWIDDLSLVEANQEEWWNGLDEASQLRMSMGLAWENWYLPQLGHVIHQPGEMKVDGIYMTHDGESLDAVLHPIRNDCENGYVTKHIPVLHECKLTYKSLARVLREGLHKEWLWVAQTKGYCKGLSEQYGIAVTRAFLHVLFACGDYKYPIRPQRKIFQIDYTKAEIDENWQLMTDYVKARLRSEETEDYGQEGA